MHKFHSAAEGRLRFPIRMKVLQSAERLSLDEVVTVWYKSVNAESVQTEQLKLNEGGSPTAATTEAFANVIDTASNGLF
jgi:hypothetical protein